MRVLCAQGWSAGGASPLKGDGPKEFRLTNLLRGKSYWVVLLSSVQLFGSGRLSEVAHHRPHGYYDCILSLPLHRLTALLALPDLHQWNNQDYIAYLKGGPSARMTSGRIAMGD